MPSKGFRKEAGDRHEQYLIQVLGGRQSRGSGNQWHAQMDGRHDRYTEEFAFAWDGKSTTTGTISVTRTMWEKAEEQASEARPMLAFRWYPTDRPTVQNTGGLDLACLSLVDLSAVLVAARGHGALLAALRSLLMEPVDEQVAHRLQALIEEHA